MVKNTVQKVTPVTKPSAERRNWVAKRVNTLRFQVLGIVIASVLIPSFLGGWFASSRINDLLRNQVYGQIETRTQRISEQLSDWMMIRSSEVQAFTVSYLLNEDLKKLQGKTSREEKEDSRKNIQSYLAYLLEGNKLFSEIMILNSDGSPLIAQPVEDWQGADRVLEVPDQYQLVSEVMTKNGSRLMLIQKMDLGRGLSPNFFAAMMKIEHFQNKIVDLAPEGSVIYLLDAEGNIKAANIELGEDSTAPEGALALLQEKEERSIYRGLQGKEVIATSAMLEVPRWGVVLETLKKEALEPLANFRQQIIFMALALAGLFLVPALLLARALILPLEELARISKRIRSGKPGLLVKSRIGGELGEFISTFNSMSVSLKDSLEEITARNEDLRVMSITDPLTGRYNRRYIEDYLGRELKLANRTKDPLTILMIDLDNFKEYNDTYGHIAGDIALKELGKVLVQTVRKTDVVARFGGEEWIICLSHTDSKGGTQIAEKLRKSVEKNVFQVKDQATSITISIGVATAPEDGTNYAQIVEAADTAMYLAKARGRNQLQVFTGSGSS
ncbi:MAG: sensor domain-containing diguanylate cyclase [bacterium]|nr:sensor domain-containing diguanylate cyclase [bacterium]